MGIGGQHHVPSALPSVKSTSAHGGGWAGPKTGLDVLHFEWRTVQTAASRCYFCDMPAWSNKRDDDDDDDGAPLQLACIV